MKIANLIDVNFFQRPSVFSPGGSNARATMAHCLNAAMGSGSTLIAAFFVAAVSGFTALPAAAQDASQCGTDYDCVGFVSYPSYYWDQRDSCTPPGPGNPPPIPANIARWYAASDGYESEAEAAQNGRDWEYCYKTVDQHYIICEDFGFAPGGDWIPTLYWHRNPDVIATAGRFYYWTFSAKLAGGQCGAPFSLFYAVGRADGWGCPDDTWTVRVDAASNHFCSRPRQLQCSAKAPTSSFGNPIDCIPGSKRETEVDYRGSGINPLEFVRNYDSSRTSFAFPGTYATTPLGSGWRTKYDRRIDTGGFNGITTIVLTREDGSLRYFKLNGGVITSTVEEQGQLQQNGTAWRYTSSSDVVEDYDASGRLTALTDRGGAALTFAYDAIGNLITATDPVGRQLTFTYDAAGRRQTMTDPGSGTFSYTYDATNNLASVTYPDQSARHYLYNEAALTSGATLFHALTGITDENGTRFASFAYDTTGRATQTMYHATSTQSVNLYSISYNSSTQRTVTDPRGTARVYSLQTTAGVSRITGASAACPACTGGLIAAVTYDANHNVSSGLDFNNKKVCYAYDTTRNLETARVEGILSSENCTTVLATPPNRSDVRKITTTWNATYRLPATIVEPAAGGSKTTTFTYDSSGNLTQKSIVAPRNDGTSGTTTRTSSWTYTTIGRVLTATDPNGNVTTSSYYADNDADLGRRGNVATITNALGHVTQVMSYDAHARPTTMVALNGLKTKLAYDARGRLTSRSSGAETTAYGYDGVGQLTQVTLPDGSTLSYTYDGAHRLKQIQDGLGNKIAYTLDAMGNRIQEQVFDPSNALSRTRSRTFDSLNRLAQDIGAASQTTGYAYDNNGNLTTATDPLSHATGNTYDALNRLTSVLDPGSGTTAYSYDPANNLIQVTDPRSLATAYTYDGLGNLKQQVSPDTGTTTSTYDASGNPLTRLDARGVTATYSYDALNRATQIVFTKTGSSTETQSFEYDGGAGGATIAKGRLTKVTDSAATTTWSYTVQGRVATKTQVMGAQTLSVAYSYNAAGQLTQVTLPSGHALGYTYLNNRVAGVSVDGTALVSGGVTTPFGPLGAWQWGNGLYTFRNHDGDGRMTSWEFRNGVSVLRNNLTYDGASRITSVTDPALSTLTQNFGYDAVDRLTQAQSGNPVAHTQQFTYDVVGNRQTSTLDSAVTTLSYASSSNRLSTLSGATTRSYTYDGVGNPSAIDAQTYTYNLANRLTQVQGGAATAVYGLNALGQRVSKAVGGTTSLFAYDELGHLLSEYDAAGNLIQEVVWLDDLPVATLRPNGTGNPVPIAINYVHADHLGSPRAVTRPSDNNIVWRWDNVDPFGASLANENPTGQGTFRFNLRFPGQYFDAETRTHYNYFRDYDPSIGRYVESDPIGLQGGLNTYAYVGGSPLMQIDAQGLASSGDRFNLPSLPRTNVVCVTNAFLRNYSDMRAANTIDGDKYFHCKANCEAARCGPNGPGLACFISDGREWFDQNIKRDPPSASQEDQVANKYGRDHANDLGMCSGVCGPFRPRGLPPQF